MKKALHFGAGNIGRGFIGVLLNQAGYEVVFADVVANLVEAINHYGKYRVITLDADVDTFVVDGVRAVLLDSDQCTREMINADLVTTAVGLGNLPGVAKIIAEGLRKRQERNPDTLLNIMACENAIRASSTLYEEVLKHCNDSLAAWIAEHVGFVDVAVDRIAPNGASHATEPLDSVVEGFFEWDIEKTAVKGSFDVPGATFVPELDPFLERKLFILNGSHAVAAYAGYYKGHSTILEAMKDVWIDALIRQVQAEAIRGLEQRYPVLNHAALVQYADDVRRRFLNPYIKDDVQRVGRDPLRKLSQNDRLVRPLLMSRQTTQETPGLVTGIALGLLYDNPADPSAAQIQQQIRDLGIERTLTAVTGIQDEEIVHEMSKTYSELKNNE